MNRKIHFKQIVLKQGLLLIIILGAVLSTMFMLFSSFDVFVNFMISLISVLLMIIILFYLNRNVPEQITIDKNDIVVQYYNKAIFKKKSKTYSKDDLSFRIKGGILIMKAKNTKVAEIRKKALNPEEWNLLIGLATN